MLKEQAPKCVSSFSGSGWILSEQEKGQCEGVILHPTPAPGGEQNGLNRSDRSQAAGLNAAGTRRPSEH